MSEKSASDEPGPTLKFEERKAHLAAGYDNSQAVVRLLDTKAAAVIGAVPVILGVLAAVLSWLQGFVRWQSIVDSEGPWLRITLLIVVFFVAIILLVLAWLTVDAAFNSVSPRGPGTSAPSILFPCDGTSAGETFASRVALFTSGPASQSDALTCYERQVLRMSQIISQKLRCLKSATYWLKSLCVASAIALFLMIVMGTVSTALSLFSK